MNFIHWVVLFVCKVSFFTTFYLSCKIVLMIQVISFSSKSVVDVSHRVAEFILYKLKEMGKISQEDISLVMQEFEELDVDQSGTLSVSDITLAQQDHPS